MKTKAVELDSIVGPTRAEMIVCPACDVASFFIYFLRDDPSHPHLQCINCNESFCANEGICEHPAGERIVQRIRGDESAVCRLCGVLHAGGAQCDGEP